MSQATDIFSKTDSTKQFQAFVGTRLNPAAMQTKKIDIKLHNTPKTLIPGDAVLSARILSMGESSQLSVPCSCEILILKSKPLETRVIRDDVERRTT